MKNFARRSAGKLALAGLLFVAFQFSSPKMAAGQKLAVLSRAEHKVVFIDLKSGEMYGTVDAGESPHEIVSGPDNRFAYIPSYGGNTVTKIDLENESVVALFTLEGHSGMHGVDYSQADSTLWITSEGKRVIIELDPVTGVIRNEWDTGQYRSHMVSAFAGGGKLYVANIDSGSVSIIDTIKRTLVILPTGAGTEGIDVSPNGREVWVSNRTDHSISVIDVGTDRLLRSFPSGGDFPVKLKFRPDGEEVWVSNNASGTVAVFDAREYSLKKTIETGPRPLGITFSPDSRHAYISMPADDQVIEVDIEDAYNVSRKFPTLSSPDGMLWFE